MPWSFCPITRIRIFTEKETKVTEWHSRTLLGLQARQGWTETIFCYVAATLVAWKSFILSFDGVCVVEKVRVGGGEINQHRDV